MRKILQKNEAKGMLFLCTEERAGVVGINSVGLDNAEQKFVLVRAQTQFSRV